MNNLRAAAKRQLPGEEIKTDSQAEVLVYPLFGRLFTPEFQAERESMARKLTATHAALERVQRQGNAEDAQKAGVIIRAYELALAMISGIEQEMR
jgi:hypothetical protein